MGQTDIAAWIATLTKAQNMKIMGESLFVDRRTSEVMTQLGDGLYFPKIERKISYTDLGRIKDNAPPRNLYGHSALRLLQLWSTLR